MTKHDAARKLFIFALWCLTGMPVLMYMAEKDVGAGAFVGFAMAWILILNLIAHKLAQRAYPLHASDNARVVPIGRAWLPSLRLVLWIVGVGGALLASSVFLGFITLDGFIPLLKAVFRFLA